jgi:Ni,Fe-hydrogenase III large subunit/Ni,Fe-hydrogenase III component G
MPASYEKIISELKEKTGAIPLRLDYPAADEAYLEVSLSDFNKTCLWFHKKFNSPVMAFFAVDERKLSGAYAIYCLFLALDGKKWLFTRAAIPQDYPRFNSLAREIYSASRFEREIKEMFGIEPAGNPDTRRLNLHDEVWPAGFYPLRKDFDSRAVQSGERGEYKFDRIDGEGVFEIPVGPVHAGIIGPGHFRFSVAGEPIINLEIRLGFTHRGVEKLFEGKDAHTGIELSERVCGDAAFSHSLSFCRAMEKIAKAELPERAQYLRAIFLELERMYNHVNDIAGIALDVGFTFAAGYAAVIKESLLGVNEKLTGSRYLKGVNVLGGVCRDIEGDKKIFLKNYLVDTGNDFNRLTAMLYSSTSFMDRVDGTGILKRKTAFDFGVTGLAGRACGIGLDLRKNFEEVYNKVNFKAAKEEKGDVLARLNARIKEFEESRRLIKYFLAKLDEVKTGLAAAAGPAREGFGLGYCESWRGPLLYWVKLDAAGRIERCKITDASVHNWQGLAYSVLGNIIPDFPVCNKSFDLSYAANDL